MYCTDLLQKVLSLDVYGVDPITMATSTYLESTVAMAAPSTPSFGKKIYHRSENN